MDTLHIISGFTQIQSELIAKSRTKTPSQKLVLWFTLTGGVLYVHDYHYHVCSMAIAVKTREKWFVRLRGLHARQLIVEVARDVPYEKITDRLRDLYKEHGQIPPNSIF